MSAMRGGAVRPGYDLLRVLVESIEGNQALVRDSFGRPRAIPADVRRGNGPRPRVGEVWLVDQALGEWTFAACLRSAPPVIEGNTGGNGVVDALLEGLDAAGLVDNQTTSVPPPPPAHPVVRVYTSSDTWTKPGGLSYVRVRVQAGGGAGGGRATGSGTASIGGGGGGGGYVEAIIPASELPDDVSVTVSAGGAGVPGGTGNDGGHSHFGSLVSAYGGQGGVTVTEPANTSFNASQGNGGGGSTAYGFVVEGQPGRPGRFQGDTALASSPTYLSSTGAGGDSHLGMGGRGYAIGQTGHAPDATPYGGGGAGIMGINQPAASGGNGAPGIVIVEEFFSGGGSSGGGGGASLPPGESEGDYLRWLGGKWQPSEGGGSGGSGFLVEVDGVYPPRPGDDPVVFIGATSPASLMEPGDTWVALGEGGEPNVVLVADLQDSGSVARQVLDAEYRPRLVELHSEHLDTVLDIGWYVQGSSSRATFALGYPKERSGWLEVLPRDMSGEMILQRYTTQATLVQFVRAYNPGPGTWYPWKPLNQHQSGVVNISSSGSPGGTVSVTFRAGLFPTPPRVHVSKQTAAAAKFIPYVTGITTSGCTIGIYAGDGLAANQTVPVFWKAELL